MSKNKKSAECQTQFQSSENIYNFRTNNEDDQITYHINSRNFNSSESRVWRKKLKGSRSFQSIWKRPVSKNQKEITKVERKVILKPPCKLARAYTAKRRRENHDDSSLQFITPVVLHDK